jgi:hypothetical protein
MWWPPAEQIMIDNWINGIRIMAVLAGILAVIYVVCWVGSWAVSSGKFAAQRDHYRKLKGDLARWKNEDQGK